MIIDLNKLTAVGLHCEINEKGTEIRIEVPIEAGGFNVDKITREASRHYPLSDRELACLAEDFETAYTKAVIIHNL